MFITDEVFKIVLNQCMVELRMWNFQIEWTPIDQFVPWTSLENVFVQED